MAIPSGKEGVDLLMEVHSPRPVVLRVTVRAYTVIDTMEKAVHESGIFRVLVKPVTREALSDTSLASRSVTPLPAAALRNAGFR